MCKNYLSMYVFRESAKAVNPKIRRGLFQFAVSSSCVNPIVYGKRNVSIVRAVSFTKTTHTTRLYTVSGTSALFVQFHLQRQRTQPDCIR